MNVGHLDSHEFLRHKIKQNTLVVEISNDGL